MVLTRRMLLALLAGAILSAPTPPAFARDGGGESDGGDDGGHDDGGHDDGGDDGGHDDGGSDNSGSDNSGSDDGGGNDSGGDDGGHDDGNGSDKGGNDDGGSDKGGDDGNKGSRHTDELSQDDALKERQKGLVIPLEKALRIASAKVRGRVIDVDLSMKFGKPQYRVKIRRDDGVIKTVRLDGRTGKIVGFLGF